MFITLKCSVYLPYRRHLLEDFILIFVLDLLMQVVNYVIEKISQDKQAEDLGSEGTSGGSLRHSAIGDGSRTGLKPIPKYKPSVEILCNNQVSGILSLYDQFIYFNMVMFLMLWSDLTP